MSQAESILFDLKRGITITPMDALKKHGCFRLAARISELRAEGHNIASKIITAGGRRYARYWMP